MLVVRRLAFTSFLALVAAAKTSYAYSDASNQLRGKRTLAPTTKREQLDAVAAAFYLGALAPSQRPHGLLSPTA